MLKVDKKKNQNASVDPDPDQIPVDPDPEVNTDVIPQEQETVHVKASGKGIVANCVFVKVRETQSIDSDVVSVLSKGSDVIIDNINIVGDFYEIKTLHGVEGFCMKKFIKVC